MVQLHSVQELIEYRIVAFHQNRGQIEIECDGVPHRISIDLPIDNGRYPEGDDLDLFIRGFIPHWHISRPLRVSKVTNVDYIKSLVDNDANSQKEYNKRNFDIRAVYLKRFMLLRDSDWTQLPDSPLSETQKKMWAKYRQALRDISKSPIRYDFKWPTPPKILSIITFTS